MPPEGRNRRLSERRKREGSDIDDLAPTAVTLVVPDCGSVSKGRRE